MPWTQQELLSRLFSSRLQSARRAPPFTAPITNEDLFRKKPTIDFSHSFRLHIELWFNDDRGILPRKRGPENRCRYAILAVKFDCDFSRLGHVFSPRVHDPHFTYRDPITRMPGSKKSLQRATAASVTSRTRASSARRDREDPVPRSSDTRSSARFVKSQISSFFFAFTNFRSPFLFQSPHYPRHPARVIQHCRARDAVHSAHNHCNARSRLGAHTQRVHVPALQRPMPQPLLNPPFRLPSCLSPPTSTPSTAGTASSTAILPPERAWHSRLPPQ
jgi:hypothetical protein